MRPSAPCSEPIHTVRLEREGGDSQAKLRRLLAFTSSSVLLTDLAVRDWARRDPAVAERLQRVDNRRMDHLRALFAALCSDPDDVEARGCGRAGADPETARGLVVRGGPSGQATP